MPGALKQSPVHAGSNVQAHLPQKAPQMSKTQAQTQTNSANGMIQMQAISRASDVQMVLKLHVPLGNSQPCKDCQTDAMQYSADSQVDID